MELLQYTAPLPWVSGQWNSCNTVPHCLGAVGSGPPAIHSLTAWGQWVVQPLQYTGSLPKGIGQWNFCNTLPHCLGTVGSGTAATHCSTAFEGGNSLLELGTPAWGDRKSCPGGGRTGVMPP